MGGVDGGHRERGGTEPLRFGWHVNQHAKTVSAVSEAPPYPRCVIYHRALHKKNTCNQRRILPGPGTTIFEVRTACAPQNHQPPYAAFLPHTSCLRCLLFPPFPSPTPLSLTLNRFCVTHARLPAFVPARPEEAPKEAPRTPILSLLSALSYSSATYKHCVTCLQLSSTPIIMPLIHSQKHKNSNSSNSRGKNSNMAMKRKVHNPSQ